MTTVAKPEPITVGPLEIDLYLRRVRVHGRAVYLTRQEYRLLLALAREPERTIPKEALTRVLFRTPPDGAPPRSRVVDSYAHRLRAKIGREFVINVWGVGYRLVEWEDVA